MEQSDNFYTTFPMFQHGYHTSNLQSLDNLHHHPYLQRKQYQSPTSPLSIGDDHQNFDSYKRRYNNKNDNSYRRSRSAANLRERRRMQCINEAFEGLRSHIPTLPYEKRLSKVDTLRLSICYINFLTELVNADPDKKTNGTEVISRKCKEQRKIVIYNARKDDMDYNDLPPVRGHSLSWSSEKKSIQRGNFVKTTKTWHPEDPRKTEQRSLFTGLNNANFNNKSTCSNTSLNRSNGSICSTSSSNDNRTENVCNQQIYNELRF